MSDNSSSVRSRTRFTSLFGQTKMWPCSKGDMLTQAKMLVVS